jgi:hypothetical protein
MVAGLCSYEVASIATGKTPTVSMLCRQRRWLAPVILVGLAVHLYLPPQRAKVAVEIELGR